MPAGGAEAAASSSGGLRAVRRTRPLPEERPTSWCRSARDVLRNGKPHSREPFLAVTSDEVLREPHSREPFLDASDEVLREPHSAFFLDASDEVFREPHEVFQSPLARALSRPAPPRWGARGCGRRRSAWAGVACCLLLRASEPLPAPEAAGHRGAVMAARRAAEARRRRQGTASVGKARRGAAGRRRRLARTRGCTGFELASSCSAFRRCGRRGCSAAWRCRRRPPRRPGVDADADGDARAVVSARRKGLHRLDHVQCEGSDAIRRDSRGDAGVADAGGEWPSPAAAAPPSPRRA